MKLELLMTYDVELVRSTPIGAVPSGTRFIADVKGGTVHGPRITGKLLPSGGDWFLLDNNGVGRVDARITIETLDGAYIYVQYYGVITMNEAAMAAMAGGPPTEYGDTYFMTAPQFETSDERYAWLNAVVAVAEGRVWQNGGEYRVYQMLND